MTEHFRQLFEQSRDAAAAESADQVSAAHRTAVALTLIYILVVGQFGLATGSGGMTQSNVHTTSRVHKKK